MTAIQPLRLFQHIDAARRRIAIVISAMAFIAIAVWLYALSWNGGAAGFLSDDAVYLLMADGFGKNPAVSSRLFDYVMRQSLFPPLYPLLLAVFGAGSSEMLRAHLVTTTTLVAALAVYGNWVYSQTKDGLAAFGMLATFALLPGTVLQNLEILSEPPYVLLTLLAIWLADRRVAILPGDRMTIALCIGLATLTRSAGLTLLPAFALWLARQQDGSRLKPFALAIFPSLLWILVKQSTFGSSAGYSQIWSSQAGRLLSEPQSLLAFLGQQGAALWTAVLVDTDFWQSGPTRLIISATVIFAVPTWFRRLATCKLDAWYLLFGGAMLLVYPYPEFFARLVWPWLPILLFYCYGTLRGLAAVRLPSAGRSVSYAYIALMLLAVAPSETFIARRLAEPVAADMTYWKHTRYWLRPGGDLESTRREVAFRQSMIDAAREVGKQIHPEDCVYGVHTAIDMLYAHRVFVQPPSPTVDAVEFGHRMQGCSYALLTGVEGAIGETRAEPFYPRDRLSMDNAEPLWVLSSSVDPQSPTAIFLHLKPSVRRTSTEKPL